MALWLDGRGQSVPIESRRLQSLAAWCESVVLSDACGLLDDQLESARDQCAAALHGRAIFALEGPLKDAGVEACRLGRARDA